LSYLLTILLAQNILKLVPNDTHDFNKYIKHDELTNMIENTNYYRDNNNPNNKSGKVIDVTGIGLNPITGKWFELDKVLPLNLHVNYFLTAKKN
jgi:2-polyprenyl-3-methyl-5-hydroxy-6-metoxy-1,4-benzoquinol methylase